MIVISIDWNIVAGITGLAGLALSLGHIVVDAVKSAKKPHIFATNCRYNDKGVCIPVYIENKSTKPLIIYDVLLHIEEDCYWCERKSVLVERRILNRGSEKEAIIDSYSKGMPLLISPNQICHENFYFSGCVEISEELKSHPTLEFRTEKRVYREKIYGNILKEEQ